jgi:predicted proteasome-type protease
VTICVAVQVNDCLVFAADSAVTLNYGPDANGTDVVNVLPHGNKVFNLHRDLPICAMTCGLGNIGLESISSLAKDFRVKLMGSDAGYAVDAESYTIKEVAEKARRFLFDEKFAALVDKPKQELNFYVGGYSSGAATPERWIIQIDGANATCAAPVCHGTEPGLSWGGQPEAINRLIKGIPLDAATPLKAAGLDATQIQAVLSSFETNSQLAVLHAAMPVQDAIDFADFLVETTKRLVRFLPGADTVGGDTDICVVTKHEGFKWVQRKHYFNTILNPPEVSYGERYPVEKGKHGHASGRGGA